ncbi:hypothetical protein BpHYR1_016745 [Brachionus plicatilis]|uniref:Uncharacterized protein n=1 Tax=Brachionus plicatilis TaxID=10195 RepID=A0A3M7Q204_BRAPC|nr:hypothetical protein BpHYR1_016745 [Brachionus plicatilis]
MRKLIVIENQTKTILYKLGDICEKNQFLPADKRSNQHVKNCLIIYQEANLKLDTLIMTEIFQNQYYSQIIPQSNIVPIYLLNLDLGHCQPLAKQMQKTRLNLLVLYVRPNSFGVDFVSNSFKNALN